MKANKELWLRDFIFYLQMTPEVTGVAFEPYKNMDLNTDINLSDSFPPIKEILDA